MKKEKKQGFTLIELLVVVLIIGILSAVALPQYQKAVEKARATQALTLIKSISQAARSYYLANNQYPTSFNELDVAVPWTGTTITLNGISDSRSNADWALEIYSGGTHEIYMVRLSGPYAGAGFIIPLDTETNLWTEDNIYCAEWKEGNYVFGKTSGDYCSKIFAGSLIYPAGVVKIFSMP